jgi:hypothetical protein
MNAAIYARKSTDQSLPDAEKSVTRQVEHGVLSRLLAALARPTFSVVIMAEPSRLKRPAPFPRPDSRRHRGRRAPSPLAARRLIASGCSRGPLARGSHQMADLLGAPRPRPRGSVAGSLR